MINATLGPPPAAAGTMGPAEPHSEGIDARDADHAGGGFSARLRDAAHSSRPAAKDGAHKHDTAAGPAEGELHQATAEAGDQDTKVNRAQGAATTATAKDAPAAAATAVEAQAAATPGTPAALTAAASTAVGATTATAPAVAGTAAVAAVTAATAGTLPATAAAGATAAPAGATAAAGTAPGAAGQHNGPAVGRTGEMPGTAAPAGANAAAGTAPAASNAAGTAAGTMPATAPTGAPADPSAVAAPADPAAAARNALQVRDGGDAASGPKPAATLTLTLAPITPDAGTAGAQATVPGAAPGGAGTEAGKPALATPAPGTDAKAAAPAQPAANAPVDPSLLGGAPAPTQTGSTGSSHGTGHAGAAGAAHAQELAKDLGMRMHVSLREGGKEVMLSMRPPELGHVVVRMVMHDGVLQAHIIADRPEAARMLEQALPHLGEALSERGYTLEGMDISYQHQAHERPATAMDGGRGPHGLTFDDDTQPADVPVGAASGTGATAGNGRLDLLA